MKKLPIQVALAWIIGSLLLINGSAYIALQTFGKTKRCRDQTPLTVIVQTGPQREALQTVYLAQLMGLSADRPMPTAHFDLKKAQAALNSFPVIKEAQVALLRPGVVYVDYAVRQPIALLADYENTAVDIEGRVFPLSPFFSPKNLPELYLGLQEPLNWTKGLNPKVFNLARNFMQLLQSTEMPEFFFIKRIDLSLLGKKSLGQREIILIAEDLIVSKEKRWIFPRLIRLHPQDYAQALGNYLELRHYLLEQERLTLPPMSPGQTLLYCPSKVIDLRLPKMALIDGNHTDPVDLQKS